MKVKELIEALDLELLVPTANTNVEITGGYASDLLSNVMGQAEPGMVWVTMQGNQNIVAIASLIGLSAIMVAADAVVEKDSLTKADLNDVAILASKKSSFEVCGLLYSLGIGKV